jgi:hypothetical protein
MRMTLSTIRWASINYHMAMLWEIVAFAMKKFYKKIKMNYIKSITIRDNVHNVF